MDPRNMSGEIDAVVPSHKHREHAGNAFRALEQAPGFAAVVPASFPPSLAKKTGPELR